MSGEAATAAPLSDAAQLFGALADETRLAIVRLLALTDLKAGEISAQLGAPQNAVSYHLRRLRSLGLLRDRHSGQDGRDVYYSVDLERLERLYAAAGAALHPGFDGAVPAHAAAPDAPSLRVLFLCTHNSARSQLAEAIARRQGQGQVEAFSAGSLPTEVHPLTLRLLDEWGMDGAGMYSKPVEMFTGQRFDHVITVCDRIRDRCPAFPEPCRQSHWSIPDPLAAASDGEREHAFRAVRSELATRIRYLLRLPRGAAA
ncbi:MAG: metalloregulator ArsR/SmtB family transcription factor [Chloroflexi bacterium]|nr:metalloregulator ArsR/SmtB family transcription factor [Chloroflexota bacterium]